jgi:hypothetical protein
MIEIEFPIRRMDWIENMESLEALTHEQALDDLMSCLDNPRDCEYTMDELLDVLALKFGMTGSRLLGRATFGLARLKAEKGRN